MIIRDDLTPAELNRLGVELANEITRLNNIVAGYEVEVTAKSKVYKLELAKAKILQRDSKYSPTMINAMAETSEGVVMAGNYLQQAEANLIVGKAELEGRDKQYMMVKKIMDLKIQEIRVFGR